MKKYFFTIALTLFLFFGLVSCSNEETKTQKQVATRPTVPILDRTVSDIDGNIYKIVTIGNQKWTKSNLNVSRYRNGDPIPQVQDPTQWGNLTTGAWCYNNNSTTNGIVYGKLYNWYAVSDLRGLAPQGYHIPTDAEWIILTDYLGGGNVAGGKMKEIGTTHWASPNSAATNSSAFTGLPGGCRYTDGTFNNDGRWAFWWSSSEIITTYAYYYALYYTFGITLRNTYSETGGYSVRCLRD